VWIKSNIIGHRRGSRPRLIVRRRLFRTWTRVVCILNIRTFRHVVAVFEIRRNLNLNRNSLYSFGRALPEIRVLRLLCTSRRTCCKFVTFRFFSIFGLTFVTRNNENETKQYRIGGTVEQTPYPCHFSSRCRNIFYGAKWAFFDLDNGSDNTRALSSTRGDIIIRSAIYVIVYEYFPFEFVGR